jgi:hypothetical protein
MNKTTYEQELAQKGFLLYTTVGRSMRPFLRSGEDLMRIEARGDARLKAGDVVLYRRKSGRYVLHRIVKVRKEDYVLCGDNCWQLEPGIRDHQILGKLTAVIRQGREQDVTGFGYRLKVNLWWVIYPLRAVYLWTRDMTGKIWQKIKKSAS